MSLINREGQQIYIKDTLGQVFSCKICDILNNAYFDKHLRTTAFEL